jgi:hypothetical protein
MLHPAFAQPHLDALLCCLHLLLQGGLLLVCAVLQLTEVVVGLVQLALQLLELRLVRLPAK